MITLKNITKIYNSNNEHEVKALKGVSLTLPNKGFVFVVGKSGSGKSTLLHILGGLDQYDSGDMIVNQKSTTFFSSKDFDNYRNSNIGFIFQEFNLIDSFTVKQNILIASNLQNKFISDKNLLDLLDKVELGNLITRFPNELSGGQKQRIAIARALVKNPNIILADEPTGSLDDETSNQILNLLKQLSTEKLIIVVSHDLEFAKKYADRIIEIKDGCIISDSNPYDDKIVPHNDNIQMNSHFTLRSAIPFAIKDFFKKPLRMVIMIFILTISFILFGLSHAISAYNIEDAVSTSMQDSNIHYASLNQTLIVKTLGATYQMNPNISKEQIDSLQSNYLNQEFYPVFDGFEQSYRSFLYETNISNFAFEKFTGAIELTDDLIHSFNLNLVAGEFPNITSSPLEIAISMHVFEVFKLNSFNENGLKTNILVPSDMIGKILTIEGNNYIISGIIETHYDGSRYQTIYNQVDQSVSYDILKNELSNLEEFSIHNLVFLGNGYQNNIIDNQQRLSTYKGDIDFRLYMENTGPSGYYHRTNFLSTLKSIPNGIIWKDGIERTTLSLHEILIPIDMIPLDYGINDLPEFSQELAIKVHDTIELFAFNEFNSIKDEFDANFVGDHTYLDYAQYITNTINNEFQNGFTYDYFLNLVTNQIISVHYFEAFNSIFLQGIQTVYTKEYSVEVVGFYDSIEYRGLLNQDVIIVSDDFFNSLSNDLFLYDYNRVIVNMGNNTQNNSEFISNIFKDSNNPNITISNEIIGTLSYIDGILQNVSIFTFYIGLLFAVFSSILLYGYISIMINHREKDIGILRALGAKSTDVMKIFVLESLLIGLASFIFASVGGFIVNFVINHILVSNYDLIITVLNFGIVQIVIIFSISILVSLLSSLIPLYRLSLKKPIDVIKGM